MPQYIEVPDLGTVEFPDGMSDADIKAAIERSTKPPKFSPSRSIAETPAGEPPLAEPWFSRVMNQQAPEKSIAQQILKLPGRALELAGKVRGLLPEIDPGIYEGAGPSTDDVIAENRRRSARSGADVIREVESDPLTQAGIRQQAQAEKTVPISAEESKGLLTKAGDVAGSMIPYVVSGGAAPLLIGLESFSEHLTNDFEAEKGKGKSDEDAAQTAFTKAIVSGGVQAALWKYVPPQIKKLGQPYIDKFATTLVSKFLAKRVAQSGETGALFALSRAAENVVSGKSPIEGVGEAALGGAAIGGVTPYGKTKREEAESRYPFAPPGAEPPVTRQPYVPPEPGPAALTQVIPPGGTVPQRTRIRLDLPANVEVKYDQTQRPEDKVVQAGSLSPVKIEPTQQPPAVEAQGGVTQQTSADQAPTELKVPPAEELAAMSPDQFFEWQSALGDRRPEATRITGANTSPVKLRQFATDAANEYVRLKNEAAQKMKGGGTLTPDELNTIAKVSTKMQHFQESLREAGEAPIVPPTITAEEQIGTRKKGGRRAVMGSGVAERENRLAAELEKVENDWSVATRSGKVNVNADELKSGDTIVVRGEPLAVLGVDEEGTVKMQGEKGGRWGERTLQAGQQIAVDEFRQGQEELFEPSKESGAKTSEAVQETTPGVQQVPGAGVPEVGATAAKQVATGKPNEAAPVTAEKIILAEIREMKSGYRRQSSGEVFVSNGPGEGHVRMAERLGLTAKDLKRNPDLEKGLKGPWDISGYDYGLVDKLGKFWTIPELDRLLGQKGKPPPVATQKYRVEGQGPQIYTLIERLPQSETEKSLGEQPVKVRNEKTGKEETVLEAQLQAVKERTEEEKASTKRMSKRELDDLIRKFGMEPSEFPNMASKREALKRARAKDREAALPLELETSRGSALGEFSTPEQIRLALRNTDRISEPHRKALGWLMTSGMMERLPGLRLEIVDYIRGGAAGEYIGDQNVARFLAWTDADVPLHEFLHHVWRNMTEDDHAFISSLRQEMLARFAPQMGDTFRLGMSSDEFMERGFHRDLYHLSKDSEFFVWMMTEKALADMNKPEAATFAQKVRGIIRQLWNGFKDALRLSKKQDTLWRKLLSGKYEYRDADGQNFAESENGRDLALVRSRRDAAQQTMNYDEMSETQKKEIGTDVELQNTFVEPLATRLMEGRSKGVLSKLTKVFGDRLAALAEVRGRGDRYDVRSYEELMADPSIAPETKQIVVGDMEKNVRTFRDTAEKTIKLSDSKIQDYQQKIVRLTEDLDVQKARRDVLTKAARRIVSDYQNRYLNRIRQGGQAGEVSVSAEVMRSLQQLKQSPDIIGRIIDQIAVTVPDEVLNRPGLTAPEILQALMENNGGNLETLSAAMGEAQRGVGREMLQTAIGIMQASDQLAENVLAVRPTINPEDVRALESLAVELRDAARKGARGDMRQLVREVGGTAETLSKVRSAIGRLQPRIRRAARQLDEWMSTAEILEEARNDPAFKELEKKLYAHFDVRSVAVKEGKDHEFVFRNPLTNEEVKILVGLDKATSGENYAKLQKLFDDAAAYLSDTTDKNYDPRLAAAWKYMIENAQQFWLNPSMNVFMPHMTPYQFDLAAFLSDPWKVLRTNAGLEANGAQVKLNAMANTKKMVMEWERKTGTSVDIANKKAARIANMTLEQWYEEVFNQVAFHNQYIGQIAPRVGDLLTNGHKVTAEDLAAVKANFNYLRRVRDIAENSPGFTAAGINPLRVIHADIARRAEPTGPMTLPAKRSARALDWGREWRRLDTWQKRMDWLNGQDRFEKIVVAHMDTYQTPSYSVPSQWREFYKGIASDIRAGYGAESIQEISDLLYESQNLDELGPKALTREQIQQQIVGEIDRGFRNFQAEPVTQQRAKPDPEIDALTAENSFTKPRSEKVTAPHTFYDYGVRDYAGRLRMGNDAYVWYGLDFVESLQRLQAALNRRIGELTKGVKPKDERGVKKATRAAQLRGDEMFDLAELKLNAKRIKTLLDQQTRVLKSSKAGRTSLESAFLRVQSAVGSLILITPGARSTHTTGMLGNSAVFNALIENRVVRPSAKAVARLVASGVKDVLKIPVSIPGLKVTNEHLRAWPNIAQPYAEMVVARREQMDRLKELGVIPESHFAGAWKSMLEDWRNVFRRGSPETLAARTGKALVAASDAYNAAAMSYAPQRYNDWVLNSNIREARNDFVLRLQENSLKHLRNRSEVLGTGYSDFSRPENVLTAQEITGRKGSSAEREAFEKRRLFKSLGMDLDQIMLRYFRAVDEARANGRDTGQIPFLTESEGKSLEWEFAQGAGLSTPATRNLAAQGSGMLRRAAGYIHGLPLSTMGRYMSLFNRLSNQTAPKYAAAVAYPVLGASLYMALMGLLKIQSTATLNRIFYKQSSALPTIAQAKTSDDWARLMLRSFAMWFPIAGDIAMGAILHTPDRFGHLDSMFVMYNFLQDLVNAGGDIWNTKSLDPLQKFGERWMPPLKWMTRRLKSETGVREHYNAVADIQSALPPSMETAASKFRGGLRPTETTPLTYRALNAMYNGDWEEFDRIAKEYGDKKAQQGVKDGALAFKHSISAHNPWVERLGKLPTDDERAQILSRMDETQKKEVEKAENTFKEFGQRYGTRIAFTQQQAELERGAAGGAGGDPTAGVGNVKMAGVSGIGNVNVPRGTFSDRGTIRGTPAGLRRISIGGRPSAKSFIGRSGGLRVSRPRRVSVGAVARPRRLVHGRLKGLSHRSSSSRKRRIRLAKV